MFNPSCFIQKHIQKPSLSLAANSKDIRLGEPLVKRREGTVLTPLQLLVWPVKVLVWPGEAFVQSRAWTGFGAAWELRRTALQQFLGGKLESSVKLGGWTGFNRFLCSRSR